MMIGIAVCALLFAAGHVVRDGFPPLGSTHAARALGGALCGLGALVSYGPSWVALALWAAIYAGFYIDMMHGEANLGEVRYGLLSGWSSVVGACIALALLHQFQAAALVMMVGLAKPAIWRLAFMTIPQPPGALFPPTRVAAGVFGLLFGLAAS